MKKINLKDKLFILLVIFSIFAYLIQAIVLIKNRKYSLWTYSEVNVGTLGKFWPYIKDFIAIILFILILLTKTKSKKEINMFFLILDYGIIILALLGNFNFRYVIAGIRQYIFFIIVVVWCKDINYSLYYEKIDKIIFKVLTRSLYLEFIFVFAQVSISKCGMNFGSGGYRFMGTFGNSGGLGYYCIAMSMYIVITNLKEKFTETKEMMVLVFCLIFMTIASGSRMAIFLVFINLIIFIISKFYEYIRLDRKTIFIVFIIIISVFGKFIYSYVVGRINRGNIMLSGGTRISIMKDLIFNSNIINMLIGNGIGYGTNSAVNLGISSAAIYDGTLNTIICQFGVLGMYIFLICSIIIFNKIYTSSGPFKLVAIGFIFSIISIFITGNYFEQIVLVLISVYAINLLIRDKRYNKS